MHHSSMRQCINTPLTHECMNASIHHSLINASLANASTRHSPTRHSPTRQCATRQRVNAPNPGQGVKETAEGKEEEDLHAAFGVSNYDP
jgi:hypothetical protein